MRIVYFILLFIGNYTFLQAQYNFKDVYREECSSIKSQDRTGTCWSFATTSFIESELMRMGKGNIDISEMYTVRKVYENKALNYMMRQGKANFSEGSLSHDLIRTIDQWGVVPDRTYSGLTDDQTRHDHSEMEKGLKGFLDGVLSTKKPGPKWQTAFNAILDVYMGQDVKRFDLDDMRFTPQSYARFLGLKSSDYISLTSFNHHPFHTSFILEIPDNYSNGSYYNLELDELIQTIDYALSKGYTIAWDGDVSEKGFSGRNGLAVLPADAEREDLFVNPGKELEVTQSSRQAGFNDFSTTDDHLMHLIGKATDQNGNKYYIIKNSWGEVGPYKGLMYMSAAYLKMKTVGILLHKDAIPNSMIR